jgi:hypothetical protein
MKCHNVEKKQKITSRTMGQAQKTGKKTEKIQKTMVTHSNRTKIATVTATGPEPEPEPEPNQSLQAMPPPLPMHQNLLSVCHYTTEMPTVLVLTSGATYCIWLRAPH